MANLAERIRRVVESFPWHEIKHGLRVTVSAGIAGTRHGVGTAEVVRRADDALYAAKRGGRDQGGARSPRFEAPTPVDRGTRRRRPAPRLARDGHRRAKWRLPQRSRNPAPTASSGSIRNSCRPVMKAFRAPAE